MASAAKTRRIEIRVTDEEHSLEPLDPRRHQVADCQSGQPSLDRWLRAYAGQSQRRGVARTFLAADSDHRVTGYSTLVAGQIEHASAPSSVRSGVSRHYPIPICLIARLAVDQRFRSKALGTGLLRDALRRTLAAAERIGIRAVVVDAIDEEAAGFYRRYGFEPATNDKPQSSMLALRDLESRRDRGSVPVGATYVIASPTKPRPSVPVVETDDWRGGVL